ncbi:MAG: hypothetical protein HPY69_14770 [Armatimonadetes bacterium]|nr:hypothetical protein [Armatimonadota bacterium]
MRPAVLSVCSALAVVVTGALGQTPVPETLWLEAEDFTGIAGYCWPMGRPEMKQTSGNWGLSGPGWAAEWTQGGESGFLSIATGPGDDRAEAIQTAEVPVTATYYVWVRYGDWREQTERFTVVLEQNGQPPQPLTFGQRAVVEEDNEMKLYWGWAFAWDGGEVRLEKGPVTVRLRSTQPEAVPRQVDVLVLTTDPAYRPRSKERPRNVTWELLDTYRGGVPSDLEPLARQRPDLTRLPEAWRLRTFQDRGFLYLWNVGDPIPLESWLSDDPTRLKVPYSIRDADVRAEVEAKYAGRDHEIPIFSDPRIVPLFHGAGPAVFRTDPVTGELDPQGQAFARWLDASPDRLWGTMMNYAPDTPIGEAGVKAFSQYRNRYVGAVSGESLGYFYPEAQQMKAATEKARTRRELVEAFTPLTLEGNAAKYRTIYGRDLDANPFADVISCLSVENIAFAPLLSQWGCRSLGYESSAMTSSLLSMRWAFMRGVARQGGHTTCTYRSCNFGDASTIFSNTQSYHSPQAILDNYYSVYSGAGMTWYKMDIWYQYMAGSSMFYHEQGFDEFWKPGGTAAAGIQEAQLSPKGKLVDRFLRVTAREPDRGDPITPVAFLVDYAHGWEPGPFWPNAFGNWHQQPDRFRRGDHERMLGEYFWCAFHPIGRESEKPMTGTNEVYVPGVFGDIFDVIFAYPDVDRWRTIDTYPVVIAAGEIELTRAEGQRLARYVQQGGTLLVADQHLSGPGLAELRLPAVGDTSEAEGYRWLDDPALHPSPRFRYRPVRVPEGGRVLAATASGDCFCVAVDRGQGRLIYLSAPHGLTVGRQALPVVPRLIAHLSRGLMPVEVRGEVEWLVNRTARGFTVTLLNPAGQAKPQQGITPTDHHQSRAVTIVSHVPLRSARDWLLPDDPLEVRDGRVECEVPAGGVRIIALE